MCHIFCNKRNFKYSSSINYWLVDIILSRSRPVGNVREIAKVELGVFTARSRNLEFISWQSKTGRILSVPVVDPEKKPSGIEVKKWEKDPLPSSRKQREKSSPFLFQVLEKKTLWCCSWRLRERSSQFQCWSKRKILLCRSRKQTDILSVPVVVLEKKPSGIVVWSQEERERSSSFKSSQRKYPLLKSNCEESFRSKSKRTRKRLPTTEVLTLSFCSF